MGPTSLEKACWEVCALSHLASPAGDMGRYGEIWVCTVASSLPRRCEEARTVVGLHGGHASLGAGDMGRYGEIWAAYTWWARQPRGGRAVVCRVG